MQVQKFGGSSPKEIGGQKHAKFGAISDNLDFDREYLQNGSRYPKSIPDAFYEKCQVNFDPLTAENSM